MCTRPARSVAKTLLYCRTCCKETTHEIDRIAGTEAANCVPCDERSVSYELDRE